MVVERVVDGALWDERRYYDCRYAYRIDRSQNPGRSVLPVPRELHRREERRSRVSRDRKTRRVRHRQLSTN